MAERQIPEAAKKQLDSVSEALSIVSENTHVYLCDMRYDYSRWSKNLVETFELPSEYMYDAGKIWEEYIHPEDRKAYSEGIEEIFNGNSDKHDFQYRAKMPDGEYVLCTCKGLVIKDSEGKPIYFGGSIRNHSQRNQVDNLTGLRNQYGFFADLQSYIRNQIPIFIGMGGISKLTEINEVLGYNVGNKVLQYMGRYLEENVSDKAKVYRLDGSRFAIISELPNEKKFEKIYEKMRAYFRKGVRLDIYDIVLELNAGVLFLDEFNTDDQTVYSCLNFAYEESKLVKHGDIVKFNNELTDKNKRHFEKLHAIRASIMQDFDGFSMVYQPVVDAMTEKIVGAEALIRWKNDYYGPVPPDMFIPFLEKDPLFPKLGEWILETSLKDAKRLLEYVPDVIINVNLSYAQLEKAGFTDEVWDIVKRTGFDPSHLCLEMTERCRLLDIDLLRNVIVTLKAGGVHMALDDFGTGFSSIGLIKDLPFNTIKIDRSFVMQIEQDEREKRLLSSIKDVAGIFGAKVCVEGIETSGMRDIIRDYRVHSFQGYYYSKPVPMDELIEMVKKGSDCFAKS